MLRGGLDNRALVPPAVQVKRIETDGATELPYRRLTSRFAPAAYGHHCTESALGSQAIEALVNAGRWDLVSNALRGPSPSGRLFGAEALLLREEALDSADAHTIRRIRDMNLSVATCPRGCIGGQTTDARTVVETAERARGKSILLGHDSRH